MQEEKMYGKIKWYKQNKGYGYINGADDETYFFERINCIDMNTDYKEGEEVLFIPNFGDMDFATKVEKINDNVK